MQIRANHYQMTYYMLLLMLVIFIFYGIKAMKDKSLKSFTKNSILLITSGILSLGLNAPPLLATSEYLQGLMCQQFSTYLFLFLGLCKTNQECIKLRDCPYTKKLLTKVFSSSSRAEKNNLIAEIRKLICKPSDRSVCCDIEGYEEESEAEGDHEEHYENKFTKTFRP